MVAQGCGANATKDQLKVSSFDLASNRYVFQHRETGLVHKQGTEASEGKHGGLIGDSAMLAADETARMKILGA